MATPRSFHAARSNIASPPSATGPTGPRTAPTGTIASSPSAGTTRSPSSRTRRSARWPASKSATIPSGCAWASSRAAVARRPGGVRPGRLELPRSKRTRRPSTLSVPCAARPVLLSPKRTFHPGCWTIWTWWTVRLLSRCCHASPAIVSGAPARPPQRRAGGPVAAHSVHPAAGWCGRGADVEPLDRSRVRDRAGDGAREELAQVLSTAVYVAAHVVGVAALDLRGPHRRARGDQVLESGREALHLCLDRLGHVAGRAGGQVAICPGRVFARGGAGRVEEARLHEQHERMIWMLAPHHGLLRGGDLVERAADVHCACPNDLGGAPWDRAVECPVELEDARAVAVAAEPPGVPVGQTWAGQPTQLTGGHVEQRGPGVQELVEGLDPVTHLDPAAERAQLGCERVSQPLRTAADHGPANPVRADCENDSEGRAGRAAQ